MKIILISLVLITLFLARWVYVERKDVKYWKDKYHQIQREYHNFVKYKILRNRGKK